MQGCGILYTLHQGGPGPSREPQVISVDGSRVLAVIAFALAQSREGGTGHWRETQIQVAVLR
jgi:hypothetical protein